MITTSFRSSRVEDAHAVRLTGNGSNDTLLNRTVPLLCFPATTQPRLLQGVSNASLLSSISAKPLLWVITQLQRHFRLACKEMKWANQEQLSLMGSLTVGAFSRARVLQKSLDASIRI